MTWPPRHREIQLDTTWEIRIDPEKRGAAERWFDEEHAPADWTPIAVPSAWQTALPNGYLGVAWMRTRLPTLDPASLHWLRFLSVATDCTGWLDGHGLGRHVGDWVPFQWSLPQGVRGGTLVLRIDAVAAEPPGREGDLQCGHLTKGFHDVISIQHAGTWQPVTLAATGQVTAIPDGVRVDADPARARIEVSWALEPASSGDMSGFARGLVRDPDGAVVTRRESALDGRDGVMQLPVSSPRVWSPADPVLYALELSLVDDTGAGEIHHVRFGFRTFETRGSRILLNGAPVHLRGVLDWGHEPRHLAPAPSADEIRSRFTRLQAMGFNTVCVCMWYPPRAYYDIADEMGMLLWQEHPVWQSSMDPVHLDEYRRLYTAFLRRDRNHPCIAIVSATCEHPSFDAELAEWWWREARIQLPRTLLQLQTAFFRWTDPSRTDLHDEHTYESSDRWIPYLDDLSEHLAGIEPKPFVMGEAVLFTSWPDSVSTAARHGLDQESAHSGNAPWYTPIGLADRVQLETRWRGLHGDAAVDRFARDGDRFHLLGRKFQVEQFRRAPERAGLVMNHLRDVPRCQCGFMDDAGRWRFEPGECRPWLDAAILILETPAQRRAFAADQRVEATLAVSNFSAHDLKEPVQVTVDGTMTTHPVQVRRGEVERVAFAFDMPGAPPSRRDGPVPLTVSAQLDGAAPNAWRLWGVPAPKWPAGTVRLSAAPLDEAERESFASERAYSKGYGLDATQWTPSPPEAHVVAAELPAWTPADHGPEPRVVISHRLTPDLDAWIDAGGAAVILASGAHDAPETSYEWLFGMVPLIIEQEPLRPGDADWVVDLLGYDLVRRWCRMMEVDPTAHDIEPIIRGAYTHDEEGVRELDLVYGRNHGAGRVVVSSLDHGDAIGRWLLCRLAHGCAAWKSALADAPEPPDAPAPW